MTKNRLPLFDLGEAEQDLLTLAELAAVRVDPNEPLTRLLADQHHVVVRSDDDLIRAPFERHDVVVGTPAVRISPTDSSVRDANLGEGSH